MTDQPDNTLGDVKRELFEIAVQLGVHNRLAQRHLDYIKEQESRNSAHAARQWRWVIRLFGAIVVLYAAQIALGAWDRGVLR